MVNGLTVKEFALATSLSTRTVYRYLERGYIHGVIYNRRLGWRIYTPPRLDIIFANKDSIDKGKGVII